MREGLLSPEELTSLVGEIPTEQVSSVVAALIVSGTLADALTGEGSFVVDLANDLAVAGYTFNTAAPFYGTAVALAAGLVLMAAASADRCIENPRNEDGVPCEGCTDGLEKFGSLHDAADALNDFLHGVDEDSDKRTAAVDDFVAKVRTVRHDAMADDANAEMTDGLAALLRQQGV